MNPSQQDVAKLYEVFSDMGILPSFYAGGGHINFDLAVFEQKPKQMARFIALFLQYRDVITAMFQHPGRFTTAEPHSVDQAFLDKLKTFSGTEEELKQFLYNEQFFNTRMGRKTKYVQLELSSYFQDVIPEEFISNDFDIKNDYWRRQFRVDPKIRKGEFRLFGAPRTLVEADLQVKLVRALMNKALNDESSLDEKLAPVDVEYMVNHSLKSFGRFEKFMKSMQLDPKEYEGYFAEGLQNMQHYVDAAYYEPYEKKMARFPKASGWKTAVAARSLENGLQSKGRNWNAQTPDPAAVQLKADRDSAKRFAERERKKMGISSGSVLPQTWREYDLSTVAQVKRLRWDKMMDYPEIALDFVFEKYQGDRNGFAAENSVLQLRKHQQEKAIKLDEIIYEMLEHPGENVDFDRKIFYVLSISSGRKAAHAAAQILEKASQAESRKFIEAVDQKGFTFLVDMATSIDLRRTLYGVPGNSYETAWGDLFARAVSEAKSAYQREELLWELDFMIRQNEISLGQDERRLVLDLHQSVKSQMKKNQSRKTGSNLEEEEDFTSLLRRRCTILLLPNSVQSR